MKSGVGVGDKIFLPILLWITFPRDFKESHYTALIKYLYLQNLGP